MAQKKGKNAIDYFDVAHPLLPAALLKRALGRQLARPTNVRIGVAGTGTASPMDELATVILSRGSTGEPKGVMLSHFNIMSNISQVTQVFMLGGGDKILGILPFFHSPETSYIVLQPLGR